MDLATILGFVIGITLMIVSMLWGGQLGMFLDFPALLVVFGGTIATLFIKHKMSEVFGVFNIMTNAFMVKPRDLQKIIGQLVEYANIARKDGILALDRVRPDDPFFQAAITHCVDGADPEFLERILNKEWRYQQERHRKGIRMFMGIAETAPAFGLAGTVIGIVRMLASLDEPSGIGPGLASALLGVFYGIILANLLAHPLAVKLEAYSQEELMFRQVIIDGMIGIQKGVNPRMLMESLKTALPPSVRQ
ncbi:MAG: MotA/TolQ/ExbB proton channel family protein [Magnetococcales bacterium]|nr:MotA/TolQ/ExbB proton channel family protein [Magnetococcales bacterium]